MRASGRSRGCDLVKLREHMPECISEYLGTDHLNTSVEEQLAHLLAEEARMGMMVGVAVGWALAEELRQTPNNPNEED